MSVFYRPFTVEAIPLVYLPTSGQLVHPDAYLSLSSKRLLFYIHLLYYLFNIQFNINIFKKPEALEGAAETGAVENSGKVCQIICHSITILGFVPC